MSIVIFFLFFIFFLRNLAPTVALLDTGEMISSSFVLGIAHPPGYPLYCIFSKLFSFIFPIANIGFRYNLLSCFYSCLCLVVFYKSLCLLILKLNKKLTSYHKLLCLIPIFAIGLSANFVHQALLAEKYALHYLIFSLVIFLSLKSIFQKSQITFLLLLFFFSIGLCNHLQIIFTSPLVIFAFWKVYKAKKFKILPKSILVFLFPLTLYLYLPLRAFEYPPLSWGNPTKIDYFIAHITGSQYKAYLRKIELSTFLEHLKFIYQEISLFGILSLVGLFFFFLRIPKVAFALLFCIILNFLYALSYDIPNIKDYYIPAYIILLMFFYGCFFTKKILQILLISIISLFFFLPYKDNIKKYSKRDYFYGYDYGRNNLSFIEKNAIVLSEGDDLSFPIWYLQYIEGRRLDVDLISVNFLQYDWYVDYLKETKKINIYLPSDIKTKPISPKQRTKILVDIIINENKKRAIFAFDTYTQEYPKIPAGIFYKIFGKDNLPQDVSLIFRGFEKNIYRDYRAEYIKKNYGTLYALRGAFFYNKREYDLAQEEFKRALAIDSLQADSIYGLGLVFEKKGDLKKARFYFKKLLKINPDYEYAKVAKEKLKNAMHIY